MYWFTHRIAKPFILPLQFFSLFKTPSTLVIKSNLLDFRDFAIAPATVSPFILYVWLFFPRPSGEIIGINFSLILSLIRLTLILFGIPTKPNSSDSGATSITLFFFVFIETAFDPFSIKDLTMSSLKSMRTSSTIFINLGPTQINL